MTPVNSATLTGSPCPSLAPARYIYTGQPLANVQQFARRLLINILLANGDAHLKNWSLIYPDAATPELAPAYDIVFTATVRLTHG